MTNEEITFANAMTEAHEAHELGRSNSYMVTSYKCPECKHSGLHANVYEINEAEHAFEIDVDCPFCKEKKTFRL